MTTYPDGKGRAKGAGRPGHFCGWYSLPDQVYSPLSAPLLKGKSFWNNFTPCPGNKGESKCFAWEQPIWRRPGDAQWQDNRLNICCKYKGRLYLQLEFRFPQVMKTKGVGEWENSRGIKMEMIRKDCHCRQEGGGVNPFETGWMLSLILGLTYRRCCRRWLTHEAFCSRPVLQGLCWASGAGSWYWCLHWECIWVQKRQDLCIYLLLPSPCHWSLDLCLACLLILQFLLTQPSHVPLFTCGPLCHPHSTLFFLCNLWSAGQHDLPPQS